MGTTADKLQYTLDSVEDIKDAIEEKGVTVGDAPLGQYGEKVRQIETNNSPFEYSTGDDSGVLKSTNAEDANEASGYHAVAIGTQTQAVGDNSFTAGEGTIANGDNQFVAGQYNETSNDDLLIVGNGTDGNNRKNALEVHADGRVTVGATPQNAMDVANKGYVDTGLNEKANTDGYYKEMTVGYAEQLLSTTGVETDDAFITRTTGGSADITSGPVQIKKIKGNTIKWNQLVVNGNFASASGWGTDNPDRISFSIDNNTLTVTKINEGGGDVIQGLIPAVIGHKYLFRYTVSATEDDSSCGYGYGGVITTTTIKAGRVPKTISVVFEATSTSRTFYLYFVGTIGIVYTVKNVMLFDLTKMFGAGNEPTIDEFNTMFSDGYYTDTNSELVSCKPSRMQTVGFNLCSCASIFEKSLSGYYNVLTNSERDTVKNWLKDLQKYNKELYWNMGINPTPTNNNPMSSCGGLGFYVGAESKWYFLRNQRYFPTSPSDLLGDGVTLRNFDLDSVTTISLYGKQALDGASVPSVLSNACMHFVWSGSRNGDFEPFRQNTLAIDTATYFPDGMRSAWSDNALRVNILPARDEINFISHKAISRVVKVDLGSLNWQGGDITTAARTFFAPNAISTPIYIPGNTPASNIICDGYEISSGKYQKMDDLTIGVDGTGLNLYLGDNRYETPAELKTALSGVYLYYETTDPVVTDIPEFTPDIYRADDYGTETWLQTGNPDPPAPVDSELFYYANLRDKLQHLPDLASANGSYLIKQTGTQMELQSAENLLKEPSSNLAVGKYFRVASIDSNGHAVLECVNPPTAPVQSVSAGGQALTPDANGNVNIPIGANASFGVVKVAGSDWGVTQSNGILYIPHPANQWISARNPISGRAITVGTFDFAVKAAMCDGMGEAWTDVERLAALLRMGCTVDNDGYVKWTATPSGE